MILSKKNKNSRVLSCFKSIPLTNFSPLSFSISKTLPSLYFKGHDLSHYFLMLISTWENPHPLEREIVLEDSRRKGTSVSDHCSKRVCRTNHWQLLLPFYRRFKEYFRLSLFLKLLDQVTHILFFPSNYFVDPSDMNFLLSCESSTIAIHTKWTRLKIDQNIYVFLSILVNNIKWG